MADRADGASRGGGGQGEMGASFPAYREVTVSAVIFAIVIGLIMNAAITYAGLKIGFTIGGSAIAAVLGFGFLRGVLRRGTILETNIAQTVASAVNTSNSGVIFTVPVLILLGMTLSWDSRDFWLITTACIAGAVLGSAFIIPLRKQMIDIERLRFPSAVGVATILKSPGAGPAKALVLVLGMLIGAMIYLPAGLPGITRPASIDRLNDLFERGVISYSDVQMTRQLHAWEAGTEKVPEELIRRGNALLEIQEKSIELESAITDDAPTVERKRLEAERAELQAAFDGLSALDKNYQPELLKRLAEIDAGKAQLASLRDTKLGWAGSPLWGYANLNIRAPAEPLIDPETGSPVPAFDQNGNGNPDPVLTRRVDRNRDGRPDLLVTNDSIDVGRILGLPSQFALVFAIAPFALGAGYITGRAGLFVLAGGVLAYFLLAPMMYGFGWLPATVMADQAPGYVFSRVNRPLGIGLLLGGAMMGVLFSLPAIREALKSVAAAGKSKAGIAGGKDELGIKVLVVAIISALILLFFAADLVGNEPLNNTDPVTGTPMRLVHPDDRVTLRHDGYSIVFDSTSKDEQQSSTGADSGAGEISGIELRQSSVDVFNAKSNEDRSRLLRERFKARPGWLSGVNPHLSALIIAIVGAAWIWFAGIIISQCTGMTDWSPISGMALLTVVLIMLMAGTGQVIGAVMIGAALCVAITLAADMMADLKTGYLVGSRPRRQQITELCVVGIGPLVAMLVVLLIAQANLAAGGPALGAGSPLGTSAPQAQALEAVIRGMQGGEMPYALYGFGALLGALLGLGAFPGLGVLVGLSMYLPFFYIATYGIGCVINMIVVRVKGRTWAEDWGVPLAAGLIVGESILSLFINIIVLVRG